MVGGGMNGGYLLATVGRALGATVPRKPDPIAISAYYLSATTPGPAVISTRVLREGGSVATVAADLHQGDGHRITALATYGDLSGLPDDVGTTAEPPDLPPVEECVGYADAPPEFQRADAAADVPLRHAVRRRVRGLGRGRAERPRSHPVLVPAART